MLRIAIPLSESFNEGTNEFTTAETFDLELEHSLASLSKWESKWEKPFLGNDKKTEEQVLDYIKEMILGKIPPEEILSKLSNENFEQINNYIAAKMTATWFNEPKRPDSREVVTAEIMYYWMVSMDIPFECQYWHLNRLLTLIKVCNYKNAPKEKMKPGEQARRQRTLNDQRRADLGSRG